MFDPQTLLTWPTMSHDTKFIDEPFWPHGRRSPTDAIGAQSAWSKPTFQFIVYRLAASRFCDSPLPLPLAFGCPPASGINPAVYTTSRPNTATHPHHRDPIAYTPIVSIAHTPLCWQGDARLKVQRQ
jgi:hypothetical protein